MIFCSCMVIIIILLKHSVYLKNKKKVSFDDSLKSRQAKTNETLTVMEQY